VSDSLLLWVAAASTLATALANFGQRALRNFSRRNLEEICRQHGNLPRFGEILRLHEPVALGVETLASMLAGVASAAAVGWVATRWQISPGDSGGTLLAAGALLGLLMLATRTWIPWTAARLFAGEFLYRTWPFWRGAAAGVSPLSWVARLNDSVLHRVFGRQLPQPVDDQAIEEEIRTIVSEGRRGGILEDEALEMIEGVMELGDAVVSQIMTPRTDMHMVQVDVPWDELIADVIEAGHTRIPVYDTSRDDVVGVLYSKDLLPELATGDLASRSSLRDMVRKAVFVPETKRVDDLLQMFQQLRTHIALVLDEYGGVSGLVTIEDVLEEIVGEIVDEYDPEHIEEFLRIDDDTYEALGRAHVDELNYEMNIELPRRWRLRDHWRIRLYHAGPGPHSGGVDCLAGQAAGERFGGHSAARGTRSDRASRPSRTGERLRRGSVSLVSLLLPKGGGLALTGSQGTSIVSPFWNRKCARRTSAVRRPVAFFAQVCPMRRTLFAPARSACGMLLLACCVPWWCGCATLALPTAPGFGAQAQLRPGTPEWWRKHKKQAEFVVGSGYRVEGFEGFYDDQGRPINAPVSKIVTRESEGQGLLSDIKLNSTVAGVRESVGLGPDENEARAAFAEGEDLFRREKYNQAAKRFKAAAARWPDSSLEQDAMYQLAESYFFAKKYPDCIDAYDALLAKYPNSPHLDKTITRQFAIARFWEQYHQYKPDWPMTPNLLDNTRPLFDTLGHSVRVYENIRLNDPTGPLADDAVMATANSYFLRGRYSDADYHYELLRTEYPRSEHQFEAHLLGLQCKLRKYQGPDYDGAPLEEAERLVKQLKVQFGGELDAEQRQRLAEVGAELGRELASREFYLGEHFENTGHNRSAKFYYASIVRDYPDTELAAKSRERLAALADKPDAPGVPLKAFVDLFPENAERTSIAQVPLIRDATNIDAPRIGSEIGVASRPAPNADPSSAADGRTYQR
jgi:CBS domain containing-hemolysin-like protein/outer membrane protein assembly factor BamD (BamD/ComL family)